MRIHIPREIYLNGLVLLDRWAEESLEGGLDHLLTGVDERARQIVLLLNRLGFLIGLRWSRLKLDVVDWLYIRATGFQRLLNLGKVLKKKL